MVYQLMVAFFTVEGKKKLVRLTVDGIFLTEQNIKNRRFTTNLVSSDSPSGICLT